MSYILIGPGLRDVVAPDSLFPNRNVEQTGAIAPVKPVAEHEQSSGQETGQTQRRQQATQAYEEIQEPHDTRVKAVMAQQIMSSPVQTLEEGASIFEAWTIFLEHSYRHLPVVSAETGELVGMVSEHDFIENARQLGGLPPRPVVDAQIQYIRQLMSSPILTATEDTELHELSRVMYDRRIGAMPILNETGELTGIITHRDILKSLIKTEPLELWI